MFYFLVLQWTKLFQHKHLEYEIFISMIYRPCGEYFNHRFKWNYIFRIYFILKLYFFWDCISWQPSHPKKLLLNLFNLGFSLKYFGFILGSVDTYFKRSLLFCCMAGRIQAENYLIINFYYKVLAGWFIQVPSLNLSFKA